MNWTSNLDHLNASRALAIGIFAILLLIIVYLFTLNFVTPLLQQWDDLSSAEERVDRVQALISENAATQTDLVKMRRSLATHSGFLRGDTESRVTSVFQNEVQETILRNGGNINSFSGGRAIGEENELVELNVRISFVISHEGFIAVVDELEHTRNDIDISSVSVHTQAGQPNDPVLIVARLLATALYIPSAGPSHDG